MKASDKALECIMKWEGYHTKLPNGDAKAYKCPAGVWTVGYGSTRNMDTGVAIKEGDVVTRETAERWLGIEADKCAAAMATRYPECNENQLAALTSLTFNIGTGGIGDGLDSLLKSKQWAKAADKLLEYNKANGAPLEGLTNRRKDERALFLEPAADEPVIGERNVGWFEARLRLTPDAWTIGIIAKAAGSDENFATAEIPVQMDLVKKFTGGFGEHSVVLAAPEKPWPGEVKPPKPDPVGEVYLKLQRTGDKDEIGCERLLLTFEGTPDFLYVRSGVPSRQIFRKANDPQCIPGSLEPIPQAPKETDYYHIHDIEWAGGKDNYDKVWSAALGPVKVWLENKFTMRRSEFMFHVDGGAPGTAGCVATTNIADLKKLVAMLRERDPKRLVVAWGL